MKKKALQGPAELDVQAAVFRVGRHATLLFNNVSRLGTGALRDDPKNGCKGDNILTVVFFNIEDITWSHGDTNFVQRVLKNIPRVSAAKQ